MYNRDRESSKCLKNVAYFTFLFVIGSERKCEDHQNSPTGFTPNCTSK